jgi:hypothetical protein
LRPGLYSSSLNLKSNSLVKRKKRLNEVAYYSTFSKNDIRTCNKEKELIEFILKNHSWTYVEKFKKHISVDHCRDMIKCHSVYQKKWKKHIWYL